ncbi:GAF and ANTAR domain-containing protein [Streptomyces zingiberis]|uniref:GAF and ANTAR domain-containing protein n=1 Tax=Streptomyces zingiberis TaxID=2053010 RepID=A0ABX1BU37_9ACTN|nr:GAF and ANTAR domain-containing protein [Streptomyces zingiberis]NJQ01230.1 GAF and ANTAR domain-containing protein [Streptomyces zingiberis]
MSSDDAQKSNLLIQWLLETETFEDFLTTLVDAARERSGAEGVGLTLEGDGRPMTVVSSGTVAPKLDEKQYGLDDGPCLRSLRSGEEILVDDLLTETRWGDYPGYAVACGIRSSLSLPIAPHSHTAAALNLYAAPPASFAGQDLAPLRSLAAEATGGIALARRITEAQEFADQMRTAMASRSVIDQALGVIMGQRRCTAEEAFSILRSASQHKNVKLRDLCADLITNLTGKPPTEGRFTPRA